MTAASPTPSCSSLSPERARFTASNHQEVQRVVFFDRAVKILQESASQFQAFTQAWGSQGLNIHSFQDHTSGLGFLAPLLKLGLEFSYQRLSIQRLIESYQAVVRLQGALEREAALIDRLLEGQIVTEAREVAYRENLIKQAEEIDTSLQGLLERRAGEIANSLREAVPAELGRIEEEIGAVLEPFSKGVERLPHQIGLINSYKREVLPYEQFLSSVEKESSLDSSEFQAYLKAYIHYAAEGRDTRGLKEALDNLQRRLIYGLQQNRALKLDQMTCIDAEYRRLVLLNRALKAPRSVEERQGAAYQQLLDLAEKEWEMGKKLPPPPFVAWNRAPAFHTEEQSRYLTYFKWGKEDRQTVSPDRFYLIDRGQTDLPYTLQYADVVRLFSGDQTFAPFRIEVGPDQLPRLIYDHEGPYRVYRIETSALTAAYLPEHPAAENGIFSELTGGGWKLVNRSQSYLSAYKIHRQLILSWQKRMMFSLLEGTLPTASALDEIETYEVESRKRTGFGALLEKEPIYDEMRGFYGGLMPEAYQAIRAQLEFNKSKSTQNGFDFPLTVSWVRNKTRMRQVCELYHACKKWSLIASSFLKDPPPSLALDKDLRASLGRLLIALRGLGDGIWEPAFREEVPLGTQRLSQSQIDLFKSQKGVDQALVEDLLRIKPYLEALCKERAILQTLFAAHPREKDSNGLYSQVRAMAELQISSKLDPILKNIVDGTPIGRTSLILSRYLATLAPKIQG